MRLSYRNGGNAMSTAFRTVPNLDHGTLCRAFELDPIRHRFDLPRSAAMREDRRISGYLMRNGDPVGTLHVARASEHFRDLDPTNEADQLSLEQTR